MLRSKRWSYEFFAMHFNSDAQWGVKSFYWWKFVITMDKWIHILLYFYFSSSFHLARMISSLKLCVANLVKHLTLVSKKIPNFSLYTALCISIDTIFTMSWTTFIFVLLFICYIFSRSLINSPSWFLHHGTLNICLRNKIRNFFSFQN